MRPNGPARPLAAPPRATVASPIVARSERAQWKCVLALARRVRRVGKRGEPMPASLAAPGRGRAGAPMAGCDERARPEQRRRLPASGSAFLSDDRLHRGDGAIGELDLDHMGADLADRLLEADLAPVDAQVTGVLDRVGDLLGPDGAEELAVLAGTLVNRQDGLGEQRGCLLFTLGAGFLGLFGRGLALLRLLQRSGRRRGRKLAGDQVVAQVAGRYVDRLTALAELLNVLDQD